MESAKPQKEHAFLERLVGEWVMISSTGYEGYDPGDAEQRFTESIKSVGGLWIVSDGRGKMPDGTPMAAIITLGFDPAKGHYVGSWIGSMMTTLWVYKGWLEPDGKTLVLEAQGPKFDGSGEIATYHDVLTLHDDNSRTFSGSVLQPDGSFKQFMSSEFRRKH
ncbi:DUF1579 domain-containing protein [Agrobacterium rosae]|uniref:DUF1579 domain-containing protein n=1 Tax=Agrobacterium rosae TaxID=1972867 RepID=A0AAW9FCP8_9HYPH|nr:DUF1579 domain-containing protein [Agrobacterium rosae]MDX8303141.1 DUF1579 domain-containing protein [Agrobacterium rosae]POO56384.1 ABC transporter permease [Agrobacterium rosae]